MKKNLLLVDGMALLFRSFFATAVHRNFMVNDKGIPTNGVNGFLKHLLTALKTFEPSHVLCCWDMGSKTYRNDIYEHYKSNRSLPPEELIPQFDLAKEATERLGIKNIGLSGYEADDCIGTLSTLFSAEAEVTILTGDRDLLQMLADGVSVALLQKGIGNYKIYQADDFRIETGIEPKALIDVKALMGDTSDNYPGVRGIGEKTAYKLIQTYKSIEALLENLHELTKSQQTKINECISDLHLSRQLAEINCSAPVECALADAELHMLFDEALNMLNDHQIKGIEPFLFKLERYREIS